MSAGEGIVSIPIGFSHQLRHGSVSVRPSDPPRFNPYRVFSSAETIAATAMIRTTHGFNPYRVFSSAETGAAPRRSDQRDQVSIPIGFSHQLRLYMGFVSRSECCFNPYRVFSSAETPVSQSGQIPRSTFQSLSGFLIS